MKHLIILTATLFLMSCGEEKSDYVKQLENSLNPEVIKRTEDSINSRYDRITKLVNAGMDKAAAEHMVDSMDTADAKMKSLLK